MFGFDWDAANLVHIAAHSVSPEEAEEALSGPTYEIGSYEVKGEERVEEVGATKAGRILKVVTTVRGRLTRVVTAYEPNAALKAQYMEYQRQFYE